MENATNHISLLQLQQMVTATLQSNPNLRGVWVMAELSDVRFSGGHCYMELIEKNAAGTTCAKIRANIWANTLPGLRSKFYAATGRDIASGIKVLVRGSVNHHAIYGLSFNIVDINPDYTLGDMERIRREILNRLVREGVAGRNKALPFPMAPQKIAVISAAGAAGYGDFINQLEGGGFAIYPMLFSAVLQGDRTAPSVMAALDKVEMAVDFWDCVVIIRGGGATTDLNGFDNLELARRVATFPIPVVVGIGHERDRTVLDELACVRCKTPTAVAAFLLDRLNTSFTAVTDAVRRIAKYSADALKGEHLRLANIEQSIPAILTQRSLKAKMRLQQLAGSLGRGVSARFASENDRISRLGLRVGSAAKSGIGNASLKLERLESMLRVLSPENTLKRGYSITRVAGHAVSDIADLRPGETIETIFADGSAFSTVTATEEGRRFGIGDPETEADK